jgi:hypothetical protein
MGYVLATSPCIGCGRIFSYNPIRVPSYRAPDGDRKPICSACVKRVNPTRIKNGLDPIKMLPGAYDPVDESELGDC